MSWKYSGRLSDIYLDNIDKDVIDKIIEAAKRNDNSIDDIDQVFYCCDYHSIAHFGSVFSLSREDFDQALSGVSDLIGDLEDGYYTLAIEQGYETEILIKFMPNQAEGCFINLPEFDGSYYVSILTGDNKSKNFEGDEFETVAVKKQCIFEKIGNNFKPIVLIYGGEERGKDVVLL